MPSRITCVVSAALLVALPGFAAAQTSDAPVEGDPVVAVVDGGQIHHSEFVEAQQSLPDQYRTLPPQVVFPVLLEQLIDAKLVVAKARTENLQDDEEVKERMAKLEDRVIREVYLTRYISALITDEILQQRYDEFIASRPPQDEINARHVLVETEGEAAAIIEEIKGGADFAEVAKEKSIGPSAERGGDIGYFTADQMVPEFAAAAFALQPGEMTNTPVQTSFGWHVIKVEDRRPAQPPGFEETRAQLVSQLSTEAMSDLVQNLRDAAVVERFNMDGTPRVETPPASTTE